MYRYVQIPTIFENRIDGPNVVVLLVLVVLVMVVMKGLAVKPRAKCPRWVLLDVPIEGGRDHWVTTAAAPAEPRRDPSG